MKINSSLLCLPLIIAIGISLNDKTGWILRKIENGITVYTRYTVGSNIKEIWVNDTANSFLSGILALLLDTKNYPLWVYRCRECKTLNLINDQEEYDYEFTDVPWPYENRDVVQDSKISQDSVTKTVTINSVALPDYIPVVHGVVRIREFHSIYTLTKLTNGKIKIDYTVYGNPGGNIPAWLINANIVIGPYNTNLKMIKRLPLYQSASYSFIKE